MKATPASTMKTNVGTTKTTASIAKPTASSIADPTASSIAKTTASITKTTASITKTTASTMMASPASTMKTSPASTMKTTSASTMKTTPASTSNTTASIKTTAGVRIATPVTGIKTSAMIISTVNVTKTTAAKTAAIVTKATPACVTRSSLDVTKTAERMTTLAGITKATPACVAKEMPEMKTAAIVTEATPVGVGEATPGPGNKTTGYVTRAVQLNTTQSNGMNTPMVCGTKESNSGVNPPTDNNQETSQRIPTKITLGSEIYHPTPTTASHFNPAQIGQSITVLSRPPKMAQPSLLKTVSASRIETDQLSQMQAVGIRKQSDPVRQLSPVNVEQMAFVPISQSEMIDNGQLKKTADSQPISVRVSRTTIAPQIVPVSQSPSAPTKPVNTIPATQTRTVPPTEIQAIPVINAKPITLNHLRTVSPCELKGSITVQPNTAQVCEPKEEQVSQQKSFPPVHQARVHAIQVKTSCESTTAVAQPLATCSYKGSESEANLVDSISNQSQPSRNIILLTPACQGQTTAKPGPMITQSTSFMTTDSCLNSVSTWQSSQIKDKSNPEGNVAHTLESVSSIDRRRTAKSIVPSQTRSMIPIMTSNINLKDSTSTGLPNTSSLAQHSLIGRSMDNSPMTNQGKCSPRLSIDSATQVSGIEHGEPGRNPVASEQDNSNSITKLPKNNPKHQEQDSQKKSTNQESQHDAAVEVGSQESTENDSHEKNKWMSSMKDLCGENQSKIQAPLKRNAIVLKLNNSKDKPGQPKPIITPISSPKSTRVVLPQDILPTPISTPVFTPVRNKPALCQSNIIQTDASIPTPVLSPVRPKPRSVQSNIQTDVSIPTPVSTPVRSKPRIGQSDIKQTDAFISTPVLTPVRLKPNVGQSELLQEAMQSNFKLVVKNDISKKSHGSDVNFDSDFDRKESSDLSHEHHSRKKKERHRKHKKSQHREPDKKNRNPAINPHMKVRFTVTDCINSTPPLTWMSKAVYRLVREDVVFVNFLPSGPSKQMTLKLNVFTDIRCRREEFSSLPGLIVAKPDYRSVGCGPALPFPGLIISEEQFKCLLAPFKQRKDDLLSTVLYSSIAPCTCLKCKDVVPKGSVFLMINPLKNYSDSSSHDINWKFAKKDVPLQTASTMKSPSKKKKGEKVADLEEYAKQQLLRRKLLLSSLKSGEESAVQSTETTVSDLNEKCVSTGVEKEGTISKSTQESSPTKISCPLSEIFTDYTTSTSRAVVSPIMTLPMSEAQTVPPCIEWLDNFLRSSFYQQMKVLLIATKQFIIMKHTYIGKLTIDEEEMYEWVFDKLQDIKLKMDNPETDFHVNKPLKNKCHIPTKAEKLLFNVMVTKFLMPQHDTAIALAENVPELVLQAGVESSENQPQFKSVKLWSDGPTTISYRTEIHAYQCIKKDVQGTEFPFFTSIPPDKKLEKTHEHSVAKSNKMKIFRKSHEILTPPWILKLREYHRAIIEHQIRLDDMGRHLMKELNGLTRIGEKHDHILAGKFCATRSDHMMDLEKVMMFYIQMEARTRELRLCSILDEEPHVKTILNLPCLQELNDVHVVQWAEVALSCVLRFIKKSEERKQCQLIPTKQDRRSRSPRRSAAVTSEKKNPAKKSTFRKSPVSEPEKRKRESSESPVRKIPKTSDTWSTSTEIWLRETEMFLKSSGIHETKTEKHKEKRPKIKECISSLETMDLTEDSSLSELHEERRGLPPMDTVSSETSTQSTNKITSSNPVFSEPACDWRFTQPLPLVASVPSGVHFTVPPPALFTPQGWIPLVPLPGQIPHVIHPYNLPPPMSVMQLDAASHAQMMYSPAGSAQIGNIGSSALPGMAITPSYDKQSESRFTQQPYGYMNQPDKNDNKTSNLVDLCAQQTTNREPVEPKSKSARDILKDALASTSAPKKIDWDALLEATLNNMENEPKQNHPEENNTENADGKTDKNEDLTEPMCEKHGEVEITESETREFPPQNDNIDIPHENDHMVINDEASKQPNRNESDMNLCNTVSDAPQIISVEINDVSKVQLVKIPGINESEDEQEISFIQIDSSDSSANSSEDENSLIDLTDNPHNSKLISSSTLKVKQESLPDVKVKAEKKMHKKRLLKLLERIQHSVKTWKKLQLTRQLIKRKYPHQSLPPVQGLSNQTCSSVATSTHQQVYPSKQYPSSGPPPYTQSSRIDPLLSPDGAAAKFPGSHVSPTSLISPRLQRNSLSPSRNVSGITSLRGLGSSTKSPRQRYATTTLDPLTRGSRRSRYLKAVPADPQSSQRSTSRSRSRSLDRSSGSDDVVNNELVSGSRVESVTSIPLPNEPPSPVKPLLLEESHSAVPPPLSVQQSTNVQSLLPIQSPLVTQAPANIQPPLSPTASQNPSISQNPPTSQNPSTNWGLSKFAPSNSNSYTYPQVSEKSSESDEDVTPDTFQRDTTSPKINPFGSVRTLFPCVNQTKPSLINLKATVQISGFTSCKPRRIVSIPSNSPQKSGDEEQGVKRQCPSSPEYCTLKRPKLENSTVDSNPKPKIASCTITRDVETDPSTESDEFSQNEKKLQEFQKERQNVLKSIIASVEKIKQSTKKMYSETPESSPSQNLVPTAENLEKMKNVFKTALDTSPKLKNLISLGTRLECEREIIDIDSFNSKYIKDSIEIPGITPLKPIDQEKDIPSKTVKLFDHDESDSPESIIDKKDHDNRIEFGGNMELSTDEEINESNNDLLGSPRDYKQKSPFVPISPQDGLSDHLAGSIVPPVISYSESTAIPNDSKNIFDDTIASPPPQDFFESPPASPYEVNDDAVKSNETDEELNDTGWNKIGVSNVLDDNTPDDDENNWAHSLSSNISGGNSPRQPKCIPIETCGQAPTTSSLVTESIIQDYDCKDLPVKVPVLLDISEDSSTPEESLGLPKIIPLDALEDTLETVSTDLPFKNESYRDQNSDSESHMRIQKVLPPLLEGHQEKPLSPDSPSSMPVPPISPQVDYPQTYSPNSPSISLNSPASDSVPMSVLELVPNDTNVSTVLEWEPSVVDILPPESAEYENSPTQSPLIKRSKVLEQEPNVVDILPLKSAEYESSPTQIPDTLIESYPGFSKPSSPKPSTSAYNEWEESDLELMEDDSDIDDLPSSLEDLIARRDVPSENKHQNYARGGASDTIDEPKEMEVNLSTRSSLPGPQVSHEETVYKMADSPPDSSSSPDFSDHDDDLPNMDDFIQRLKHNQTTNPKNQEQKEETSAELQSNHPVAENNPETEPDSALTEMDQLRNQLDSLFSEKSNRLNVIRQLNEDEKELNERLRKGGILKLSRDITTATEDVDLTKEQKSELQKFEMQDHDILDEAPGEIIFDSACAQCLFSFPVTLTLGACGFDPGASSVDRTLSTVDPDCLLELLGTEYLELCFERVSCPDAVLEWAFLLMSVHPSRHVEQSCVKLLLHILNKQQGKGSHWVPGPLQLARVLVNYGADLQQLLPQSNMVDFTDDDLVLSTNKENNAPGDGLFRQRNPLPDLLLRPAHSIVQDNFSGVLRILAEAVARRPQLYSVQEQLAMTIMLLKTSLDQGLSDHCMKYDLTVALEALLNAVPDHHWNQQMLDVCDAAPAFTNHHHNMLELVEVLPPSERGLCLQRHLSFLFLNLLCFGDIPGFSSDIKVQQLLPIIQSLQVKGPCDFYFLSSVVILIDRCVGVLPLPGSEKPDLKQLTDAMKGIMGSIREHIGNLDRSVVKDLMAQLCSKWSIKMDSMGVKQRTLFQYGRSYQVAQKLSPVTGESEPEKPESDLLPLESQSDSSSESDLDAEPDFSALSL